MYFYSHKIEISNFLAALLLVREVERIFISIASIKPTNTVY